MVNNMKKLFLAVLLIVTLFAVPSVAKMGLQLYTDLGPSGLGSYAPASGDALILESDDYLLLENGDRLLLE